MPEQAEYAGLGSRILAFIVDSLLLGVVVGIITAGIVLSGIAEASRTLGVLLYGVVGLLFIGYFIYYEGKTGQTIGKRITNIRVVKEDGSACDMKDAAIRNVLRIIDGQFSYIVGIIIIVLTEKDQRLGDLIAKTVVVKA